MLDEGGPFSRNVASLIHHDSKLLAGKVLWDLHGTSEETSATIPCSILQSSSLVHAHHLAQILLTALQLPLSPHETLTPFHHLKSCDHRASEVDRRLPAVQWLAGQCPVQAVAFPCRPATGTEAASLQLKAHRSWSAGNTPFSVTEEVPKALRHPESATKQKNDEVKQGIRWQLSASCPGQDGLWVLHLFLGFLDFNQDFLVGPMD